jgi:tetratricopeptide (TPR) repeat protein
MWPFLLFLAVSTGPQPVELRAGSCEADADVLVTLPPAHPVQVRSSVSTGGPVCYRITARLDGRDWTGYVLASALTGLETYRGTVSQAEAAREVERLMSAVPPAPPAQSVAPQANEFAAVLQLVKANQHAQALDRLKPILRERPQDPDLLILAGYTAWRADQLREARAYLDESLAIRPHAQAFEWRQRIDRELGADHSQERLVGARVALRYEGASMPAETARVITDALDTEYSRVAATLGCPTPERLAVIVQSPEAYRRSMGAAEWSGGLYDGRIHLPWEPGSGWREEQRRVVAHEVVHACLANAGQFPAWLHEGLAQRLSGERLPSEAREQLRDYISRGGVPPLEQMSQSWSGMNVGHARVAYGIALWAAELLERDFSPLGLAHLVRTPSELARITPLLNQRLGLARR